MIADYTGAQSYLESFINAKVYEHITSGSKDADDALARMRELLRLIGDPHLTFPSVVVSGTSGKGSTANFIATMLAAAGYRTGLAISPHLQKITERMQLSKGSTLQNLDDNTFITLLNELRPVIDSICRSVYGSPTYYEILMALTMMAFTRAAIDIAVVEVGLEGRFDATNLLRPLVFTLTNISFDHVAILGHTIPKIADEATYRINNLADQAVVVTGVTQPSVVKLVESRAQKAGASISRLGRDFFTTSIRQTATSTAFDFQRTDSTPIPYTTSMLGRYQADNAALALETTAQLEPFGFMVPADVRHRALAQAFFPGRFERFLARGQPIILDGAHNPAKMRSFIRALHFSDPPAMFVFVLAFKQGKDVAALLRLIAPCAAHIIATSFAVNLDMGKNMSLSPDEVEQCILQAIPDVSLDAVPSAAQALERALSVAAERGATIVVTGSLYLVGEVRQLLAPAL